MLMYWVSMMICAGCSVKENRTSCPCKLVLDFRDVNTSVINAADLILAAGDGFLFSDELYAEDFSSEMSFQVPRTMLDVGAWSGTEGMMNGNGMVIPEGKDCPPVYLHYSVVDTGCDAVSEKIVMRKNHCRMTVNLECDETEAWKISIYGNVDGYMPDGTPSEGRFSCGLGSNGAGGYDAILPRQIDDSLILEIDDGSGIMKRFSLGVYVAESGYDWNAPDLEDIAVDINLAFTGLTLTIGEWDGEYKYDIVI